MQTTKVQISLRGLISTFVVCCLDSIIPSLYIRNFKPLSSFCGWAGQFESTLVANPEDRFSLDPTIVAAILERWTATNPPIYKYGDIHFGELLGF